MPKKPTKWELFYPFTTKHKGLPIIAMIWMLVVLLVILSICLIGATFQSLGTSELKIVTYNIWNYHSFWNIRKNGVAAIVRSAYPDILLLQEVRSTKHNKQLDDLQALLPFFKFSAFGVATPNADFQSAEGLGILSRYPIISTDQYNFTIVPSDADKNTRTCLSALIDVPNIGEIQVYVTHLSYEKTTQCRQIAELVAYIEKDDTSADCSKTKPRILAGDFNIYADFEAPADSLTKLHTASNLCNSHLGAPFQNGNAPKFTDVWQSLHPNDPGLTFSLMPFKDAEHFVPSTGLESRPDRIYLKTDSCKIRPKAVYKTAGDTYSTNYQDHILYEQLCLHLTATSGHYIIFVPALACAVFVLFQVPRFYLCFALMVAFYVYFQIKDYPSNPDDFYPSDHLALVASFAL